MNHTPLQRAAQGGFGQSVRCLLKHEADARTLDDKKRPPIYYAITNDHLLAVQEFFQHDETLVDLPTQITWAINSTASTVFKCFISLGQTTVDDFDNFKADLFYDAVVEKSAQNLDFLLQSGLDPNLRRQGSSPLHWAAQGKRDIYIISLRKFNASLDARDSKNRTPLHYAAENDAHGVVKVLLDEGSDG
ncbi:ankyrin repeat-containing domain protein [Trichoderma compactum]